MLHPRRIADGNMFLKRSEEDRSQDHPWLAVLDNIRSSKKCMTTKNIVLTSSFDWESVQLDKFNELIILEHGIRELIKRVQEEEFRKDMEKIQKEKEVTKNRLMILRNSGCLNTHWWIIGCLFSYGSWARSICFS